MPSIFHHLKEPQKRPGAWVKRKALKEWLDEVGKTEITINGRKQTLTSSGVFAGFDAVIDPPETPFQVTRGESGWLVSAGYVYPPTAFVESRLPKIGGVLLDNDPPPSVPFKDDDDTLCVQVEMKILHRDPLSTLDSSNRAPFAPETVANPPEEGYEWIAWPLIKWLSNITQTATPTLPISQTEQSFVCAFPIAEIVAGKAYPLRQTEITLAAQIGSIIPA